MLKKGDLDAAWQAAAALAASSRRDDPVHDLLFSIEEKQRAKLRQSLHPEKALDGAERQSSMEPSTPASRGPKSPHKKTIERSMPAFAQRSRHLGRLSI